MNLSFVGRGDLESCWVLDGLLEAVEQVYRSFVGHGDLKVSIKKYHISSA